MKKLTSILILTAALGSTARADVVSNPQVFFNLTPDLPVQAALSLTAISTEKQALNCVLQIQADLRYANDATLQGTLLLPNVAYRTQASGLTNEPILIGGDELINQGVPGLRYAGGRVLSFSCSTDRPSWEVALNQGDQYYLIYGQEPKQVHLLDPRTGQDLQPSELASLYTRAGYVFDDSGKRLLTESGSILANIQLPNVQSSGPIRPNMGQSPVEFFHQARFSRGGAYVVATAFDPSMRTMNNGKVKVFDANTSKFVKELTLPRLNFPTMHTTPYEVSFYAKQFTMSPLDDRIVLANPTEQGPPSPGKPGLTVYSFPQLEKITEFGWSGARYPRFSNDGSRLAFVNSWSIVVNDAATYEKKQTFSFGGEIIDYAFSPSGNNIIALTANSLRIATIGSSEDPRILWIPNRTTKLSRLSVSPDGKFIAIPVDYPDSALNAIIVIPTDGASKPRYLENAQFSWGAFTPVQRAIQPMN